MFLPKACGVRTRDVRNKTLNRMQRLQGPRTDRGMSGEFGFCPSAVPHPGREHDI